MVVVILIEDTIREDAIASLKRERSTDIIMAIEDNANVGAIAKQLNVDEVYAKLTLKNNMELIESLQKTAFL